MRPIYIGKINNVPAFRGWDLAKRVRGAIKAAFRVEEVQASLLARPVVAAHRARSWEVF